MRQGLLVHAVRKGFKSFDLGPLSLEFLPGRLYGLLGPNGAGKTTLLGLISLQVRLSSGRITCDGTTVLWGAPEWKDRVSYVREVPSFYSELTVTQTLQFARRLHSKWDEALCVHLMDRFGLEGGRRVGTLSKGTKVRLGIVAAASHHAELLLLDEPTSGVDPSGRQELRDVLQELRQQRPGVCVILSSHLFEDLTGLADEVLILRDGKLAFKADKAEMDDLVVYRLPPEFQLPPSADVRLAWGRNAHRWVMAASDSSLAGLLRGVPGCVQEPPENLLAAAYKGTEPSTPSTARD